MKVLLGQGELERRGDTPPVDSRSLGRFVEEAQVTGQLDHPGIVPVHELGLDPPGRVYFTMKLVQGRTLKEVFELAWEEREGWKQSRVLSVLLRVCEAMAYAHHKGVVHRDLKPANVMVGRFGEVFVMDWGLAKVLGRPETKDVRIAPMPSTASLRSDRQEADAGPDSPLLTMDGDVLGTPAYMAPEQAQGKLDAIGPRTDVYSVGAMLYHLLAGQMPYCPPGARVTNRTVLAMVLQGPPAPLRELRRDIPAELQAICEKAMARRPEQRYGDISALASDLQAFLDGGVVRALRSSFLRRVRGHWKRQSAPTRVGVILAYAVLPPFFVAVILVMQGEPSKPVALLSYSGLLLLPFASTVLLLAGLFVPRRPRLLGAIALVPPLFLLLNLIGVNVIGNLRSDPEWRRAAAEAIESGRFEEAIVTLRATPLAERRATDQIDLARSLWRLGRLEEAVAAIDDGRGLHGWELERNAWKALLLLELDRAGDARAALEAQLEGRGR